ncbi:glycosyltransferase family 1 protein [Fulvimarina endophytica]|uniref:Glycosyltransferase family 1 protein n=1 Tax=Fulvimarina endophytica TaxID=2293836 RepID=A0A371XA10_9HYPH|nr:glycosyltransferase family 4 protein [Fulvimarina endophytica]RFC66065.1 glycosyltransferase family 1 protein [Fulvimarina endophytica]
MSQERPNVRQVAVVAPNFKKRLSGVTSTIVQLLPIMARRLSIASMGPDVLPANVPRLPFSSLLGFWSKPVGQPFRIWHARRNIEMLPGIVMRDVLRMPIRLVFTSASQREHTAWTRHLIARMDGVVATSDLTASYLKVPNRVIRHGIDLDRFHPSGDRRASKTQCGLDPDMKTVGCFGRIRHQKGTDLFVDAMISLLPGRPGWNAIVAGRATEEHRSFLAGLKRRVAEAGLSDRILFVGEHDAIAPWYRALDLFVAPQRWEGFGLTPLEAMASAVPVVATRVGAFPELILDGRTGRLVERDRIGAIVDGLRPFLDDEAMREECGRAAHAHVSRHFPLSGEVDALIGVYEDIWAGRSLNG